MIFECFQDLSVETTTRLRWSESLRRPGLTATIEHAGCDDPRTEDLVGF